MVRRSHTAMPSSTVLVAEDIVGLDVEMMMIMIVIVMTHLVSTIMIRELKTSVTTISRGITTP